MKSMIIRLVLIGTGAALAAIGGAMIVYPKALLAISDVFVELEPNLMSELAAPSGVLLGIGALMILGAFKLRFANIAMLMGAVVYGSYGVGRALSMSVHGLPSESLIAATLVEFTVALLLGALGFVNRFNHDAAMASANIL